jgi:hypothetical protein
MSEDAKAQLIADGIYDEEFCDEMTTAEAETLLRLHQQYGKAFDAICDELAAMNGVDKSRMSVAQKTGIVDEAEFLIEEFDEADVAGRYQKDTSRLMLCLRRHHSLALEIMNVRDGVIERFAKG